MNKIILIGFAFFAISANSQEPANESQIQAMFEDRLARFQGAPTPEAKADAYVKDVVDNAVWLPQSAPPVRGKEAVRTWSVDFFSKWILEIDSCEIEPMLIDEEMAVRRFSCNGTYVEIGSERRIPFSQKYVDVLQKQSDGTWKLESHMWSSNNKLPSIWSE